MASTALEVLGEKVQDRLEEEMEGITILWGPPVGDDHPAEAVLIATDMEANSGRSERQFRLIGGEKVDEDISLPISVQVIQTYGGTDLKASYTRSMEIAAEVETAIRKDIGFDHLLIEAARISTWRGRYLREGEARGHMVFMTLSGTARI